MGKIDTEYRIYFRRALNLIEMLAHASGTDEIKVESLVGTDGDDYILSISCAGLGTFIVTDVEPENVDRYLTKAQIESVVENGYTNVYTEVVKRAIPFLNQYQIIEQYFDATQYIITGVNAMGQLGVIQDHIEKGFHLYQK